MQLSRWRWPAVVPALGLALALASRAEAQTPGEVLVEDDLSCAHQSTLDFDSGSARINLASEANLNAALQWLVEAPERYLLVLGPDGPSPADRRLGQVRVQSVVTFLVTATAAPNSIIRGDFSEVSATRRHFQLHASNVAVMACELAPVGF
jgi:hypothetical protein